MLLTCAECGPPVMVLAPLSEPSGPLSGKLAGNRSPALISTPTPVTRGAGDPPPRAVFSSQQHASVRSISTVRRWKATEIEKGNFIRRLPLFLKSKAPLPTKELRLLLQLTLVFGSCYVGIYFTCYVIDVGISLFKF